MNVTWCLISLAGVTQEWKVMYQFGVGLHITPHYILRHFQQPGHLALRLLLMQTYYFLHKYLYTHGKYC
jgi:hypothetical protein